MSGYIDDLIQKKIEAIAQSGHIHEMGRVQKVQDYILEVGGLEGVAFFERVLVSGGSEGYITAIGRSSVMVALVKKEGAIHIGDEVVATGEEFCALFSPDSIGHVVDIFGMDKLAGRRLETVRELVIESPPIPIMDRTGVNRPMLTGIAGIDLLYPIGRGQRQLIIGDKKTGKTQVALDTIVNQHDQDVLCLYIAIGKTKKEVKEIYSELLRRGAMNYTIILAAFNDECPPVLRNTPYAGLSIAEQYMMQGRDVLVVIDDLKRHADVYREISLLSGKAPGRDAYPPDIFYAHASLLEKGCQHQCGGSVTVLPIVETKAGDITDYISTNIISITDGQIVLSKKLFEKGQKPAINYGLSVSRLGGAVQVKNIKVLGAVVRRELLAYLETRDVFELANMDEMGAELQARMERGHAILDGLCQYKFAPRTPEQLIEQFTPFTEVDA